MLTGRSLVLIADVMTEAEDFLIVLDGFAALLCAVQWSEEFES